MPTPLSNASVTTLELVRTVAVVIQALAALGAAVFVSIQIRHIKRTREVDTFIRVIGAANESYLRKAADWVKYDMSPHLSYESAFRNRDTWSRVTAVTHFFEMIGVLVTTRHVPPALIFDQMGPWIAGSWARLRPLIHGHRGARNAPDYCENFELLVRLYHAWAEENPAKLEKRPRVTGDTAGKYYEPITEAVPERNGSTTRAPR